VQQAGSNRPGSFEYGNGIRRALFGAMPPRDLQERTRLFALAVVRFCRTLPDTKEANEEGDQLRRAANAVRRNDRAARRGRSRAEFESKLGTVFEEADECVDCLEALRDARIKRNDALIQEARELASIFAKSVSTARKNTRRSKDLPNS
jgi:four helix bundle protein